MYAMVAMVICMQWLLCLPVGRYWEMVERLKVNQFYTAPTAIRLLIKAGEWATPI